MFGLLLGMRFAYAYHSLCSWMNLVEVGVFALLMRVIRFAHVYRSLYSCVSFALLMCIVRFTHAYCSLCSCTSFALLMRVVRFAHDCFWSLRFTQSFVGKERDYLPIGRWTSRGRRAVDQKHFLAALGRYFLFFTSLIRERMDSFKNKKAPVLSNKCFWSECPRLDSNQHT